MMRPKIAVLGSLNMDLVITLDAVPKEGQTVSGKDIHHLPGGKGANQAVGCARLGTDVLMIGAVGQDTFGQALMNSLSAERIRTDGIRIMEGQPTGTAAILHTADNNRIVVVPGANGGCTPEWVARFEPEIKASAVFITQLEIPLETVEYGLKLARENGAATILNPAPAKPLSAELLQSADFLTPNETEFEELSGEAFGDHEERLEHLLKDWEAQYRHKVIVTRGDKGCSYLEDGRLQTVKPPKVQAVDTTGAGDCFNAALAVGIATGRPLREAVQFAVKASALSVTKFGAQAGMPTIEELID